jgi:hypothetical protein
MNVVDGKQRTSKYFQPRLFRCVQPLLPALPFQLFEVWRSKARTVGNQLLHCWKLGNGKERTMQVMSPSKNGVWSEVFQADSGRRDVITKGFWELVPLDESIAAHDDKHLWRHQHQPG